LRVRGPTGSLGKLTCKEIVASILRDSYQPQPLLQYTDFEFRILQLVLIREDSVLKMAELIAHRGKQRSG